MTANLKLVDDTQMERVSQEIRDIIVREQMTYVEAIGLISIIKIDLEEDYADTRFNALNE
jgi:hypothetical protein